MPTTLQKNRFILALYCKKKSRYTINISLSSLRF